MLSKTLVAPRAMNFTTTLPFVLFLAAGSCPAQTLVISLYDYSNLSAKEIGRITETTGLVLADSGIHIDWVYCRGALAVAPAAACEMEPQANHLVVRFLPDRPRMSSEDAMGHANVTAEGGNYASVFVPAVREQAPGFGVASDLLMGYVVAHEVGHCLLGPHHSETGLMRGGWNRKDAEEISRLGLHLTKREAQKAAARLGRAEPLVQR
jgi:hypothetical protein